MLSLSIACLSGFILAALTLTVAPQDSIAGSSDTRTSSSSPLELLSSSNQSMSSSKESFPAPLPPLPANMAALKALGLDTDEPISWETTPSGAMIRIQCHIRYGRRLDYQDCRDAYRQIPRSNETVARFAHRQGGRPYDVALPQRYLGSKGKCGINPNVIDPFDTATASARNVADAAYTLIDRCAPRSGGIAIDIGGDNHLYVLLQPYIPTVRCEDSAVPISRESCSMIERGVEADIRPRLFGDRHLDPAVDEPLPYDLTSRDEKCAVRISSTAGSDTERWFHLWEAIVALNAMCARAGKRGTASLLGLHKRLNMELSDQPFLSSFVGAVNGTAIERI